MKVKSLQLKISLHVTCANCEHDIDLFEDESLTDDQIIVVYQAIKSVLKKDALLPLPPTNSTGG